MSGMFKERGQYVFSGKTAGALITGNEDGAKYAAMSILYSLQHIGYVIPPSADVGGIPGFGNLREAWNEGERSGFDANPEYR